MVQILEAGPNFGSELGKAVGAGVGAFGREAGNLYAQRKENEALKKVGINIPSGLTPETRQMLVAEKLRRGVMLEQGEASIPKEFRQGGPPQVNSLGASGPTQEPSQATQSTPMQNQPMESPRPSTQKPIIPPEQMGQIAAQRFYDKKAQGVATTHDQELDILRRENQDNINYRALQEAAGAQADAAIKQFFPEATDEQLGIFNKKAEEYTRQGLSPGDMKKQLGLDAKKFKNDISRVEDGLAPNRLGTKINRALLGTGVDSERAVQSLRVKVKPLLDMGLYDTARNLLAEKGYAPEERERIVSSLGETATKALADFPSLAKTKHAYAGAPFPTKMPTPIAPGSPEAEKFQSSIKDVLKKDPATNLTLLRRGYMDKGVDWRTFLYTMNDMIENGEFKPNEDQDKAIEKFDEPPLNNLDKFIYEIGLQGI